MSFPYSSNRSYSCQKGTKMFLIKLFFICKMGVYPNCATSVVVFQVCQSICTSLLSVYHILETRLDSGLPKQVLSQTNLICHVFKGVWASSCKFRLVSLFLFIMRVPNTKVTMRQGTKLIKCGPR